MDIGIQIKKMYTHFPTFWHTHRLVICTPHFPLRCRGGLLTNPPLHLSGKVEIGKSPILVSNSQKVWTSIFRVFKKIGGVVKKTGRFRSDKSEKNREKMVVHFFLFCVIFCLVDEASINLHFYVFYYYCKKDEKNIKLYFLRNKCYIFWSDNFKETVNRELLNFIKKFCFLKW